MLRYVYHLDCYIYHFCHFSNLQWYIYLTLFLPQIPHIFTKYRSRILSISHTFTHGISCYIPNIHWILNIMVYFTIYLKYIQFTIDFPYIYIRHIYHLYIYIQKYFPQHFPYTQYIFLYLPYFCSPIRRSSVKSPVFVRARGFGDRSAAWFRAASSLAAAPLWPLGIIERMVETVKH